MADISDNHEMERAGKYLTFKLLNVEKILSSGEIVELTKIAEN